MYESDEGGILFRDTVDVRSLKSGKLKKYREKVKYVFQDPARSLNPRMTVYDVMVSGYRWSSVWPGEKQGRREAAAILEEAGLQEADLERRPTEFSGGQRQRISIARGLIMKPDLLICDEVVSALDVSIQGQILNLLLDIKARRDLSFLFIAHDLRVASYFCDRIAVMYRGELMEEAPAEDLYRTARHPYTKLLFSAVRGNGETADKTAVAGNASGSAVQAEKTLAGEVKTATREITGCAFAERCPLSEERCLLKRPSMEEAVPGHKVRCWKT
jgi:oligopeptide/dipeptide ABC transporter ATP-binding protein